MPDEPTRLFTPYFTVLPDKSFDGLVELFHANGRLKYRGKFCKGRRVGQHIEFQENGNVLELSYWKDDWVVGTALRFDENGRREEEEYYGESGSRDGCWITRDHDPVDDKLVSITKVTNGTDEEIWVDDGHAQTRFDYSNIVAEGVKGWLKSTGRLPVDDDTT